MQKKNKKNKKKKKYVLIIETGWRWKLLFSLVCIAAAVGLQLLARKVTGFGEFYANYVYPIWVNTVGRLMSVFPVSVSEILLYILIFLLVVNILKIIFFRKGVRWKCIASGLLTLLAATSLLFVVYTLNCGINYYRQTFSTVEGFEISKHSVDDLRALCRYLTEDLNSCAPRMIRSGRGIAKIDTNVDRRAVETMKNLGEVYDSLDGYYPISKPLIVSQILSYQQLSGIYSPFTVEANYNRHMTAYNIPFTACHELSHLKGFMREDEANFIAYLACVNSDYIDFRYSGALLGWIYATNELYTEDVDLYNELMNKLYPEVLKDLEKNAQFWEAYEGKTAEISDKINDTYLKANNQQDGVKSYNRVVDLMLDYYKQAEIW